MDQWKKRMGVEGLGRPMEHKGVGVEPMDKEKRKQEVRGQEVGGADFKARNKPRMEQRWTDVTHSSLSHAVSTGVNL